MRKFESLETRHMMTAGLVRDFVELNAGSRSPFALEQAVEIDGTLFYSYGDNTTGSELWRTDGTEEGTFLVTDLVPGNMGSEPQQLFSLGDRFIFGQTVHGTTVAMWATDGTADGTSKIHDQLWHSPVRLGDRVVFVSTTVDDETHSRTNELWETDGTREGTKPIAVPAEPRSILKHPEDGAILRTSIGLFQINEDLEISQITMSFDGSSDFFPFGNDQVLFTRRTLPTESDIVSLDLQSGESTTLITVDSLYSPLSRYNASILGDFVFFHTVDGDDTILLKTDGTPEGTNQVSITGSQFSSIRTVNDAVYLTSVDEENGTLWKVEEDSTTAEVVLRRPLFFAPNEFSFPRASGLEVIYENEESLYVYDPTGEAIWQITSESVREVTDDFPMPTYVLGESDGQLLLIADDGVHGDELWRLDLESGDIELVRDANLSTGDSFTRPLGVVNGRLILSSIAADNRFDLDVLSFDGTEYNEIGQHLGSELFVLGEQAVFSQWRIEDEVYSTELWSTDGTVEGTDLLFEDLSTSDLFERDGIVHFRDQVGNQWRTDGTDEGTFPVDTIPDNDEPRFEVEGGVYILIPGELGEGAVWFQSDALELHRLGNYQRFGAEFAVVDSKLIVASREFNIFDVVSVKVEVFDGLANEVVTLGEFPREEFSDFNADGAVMAELNGLVYFAGSDSFSGEELWVTDGTLQGTAVYDIWPGVSSSQPTDLVVLEDELYFSASDEAHGRELWKVSGEQPVAGDLNQDGDVDLHDFDFFRTKFAEEATRLEGDLDGDGIVGFQDFLILHDNYGHRSDPPVTRNG